jgi:hypothetical protein
MSACSFEQHQSVDNRSDQQPPTSIELEPISELPQRPGEELPEPVLINGRVADPKDFPASVYSSQGNSRCTATVVGERVLFIAAHCVSNGGTAAFRIGSERYTSTCTHSSDYRGNSTADYSLCVVDKAVEGIPYENVNQDESLVGVGDEVLLTGFGCVQPGGGGGNDGKYRVGEAKVLRTPSGNNNDIVTGQGAALCYGDSGGPAFKYLDAAKTKRVQISINSRGDIARTSYLSATHTNQGKRFIKAWSDKSGLKICGVHAEAKGCRGGQLPPPPPPPDECKAAFEKVGQCLKLPTTALDDSCWKAYARLFQCLDKSVKVYMGGK